MDYLKPKPLTKGDTISFIAPAGGVKDKAAVYRAKDFFERNGFNIVFSEHLFNEYKYMSDTDENRLKDLHNAFSDKNIDAIICARGGYGTLRLINDIDYDLIKNNPKIFCGYSDITILSLMFLKKSGLITYSGPMARGDFGLETTYSYTIDNFYKTLYQNENLEYASEKIYKSGSAEGIIWGGNLASVNSLSGTDFIPDKDFIFFAEDLNEPVYKIDRMFNQLINIREFKHRIKGMILGDFLDSGYPEQLDELFYEISEKLNIPVLGGFKITHEKEKITIPVGANSIIENGKLTIQYIQ